MTHEQIRRLKTLWKQRYPRRASGGLWALSGFAFQASRFLVHFFEGLDGGGRSPDTVAEMEGLSDILAQHDGNFLVVQVKRRLDRSNLRSALTDLYIVADLCRRELPDLLPKLRFQVVCQEQAAGLDAYGFTSEEVVPRNDKKDENNEGEQVEVEASWQAFRAALKPIVEARDDRVRLQVYLWNQGVRNPRALIERSLGWLLDAFEKPDRVDQIGYDLVDFYASAERRRDWRPIGRVLMTADVEPIKAKGEGPRVLIGARPRLEDLRRGRFRDRPLFTALWLAFCRWLATVEDGSAASGKIPIFWIDGRSGEGKSVLLLQLVAAILRSKLSLPLVHLAGGRDVTRLVTVVSQRGVLPGCSSRLFGVVDDLYDVADRETFAEEMRNACALALPSVALITCGPTEQLEQFSHDLKSQVEVTFFTVPILESAELQEFVAWFAEISGQEQRLESVTTENTILVQLLFELAQGRSLPDFARRFRRRLERIELFEEARRILAANALYIDAPLALLKDDARRDALHRLSAEDQLHFQINYEDADGERLGTVCLSHPHLAWLLILEWVRPPSTLGKVWARDLIETLEIYLASPLRRRGDDLLYALQTTPRLTNERGEAARSRQETLIELYRLHVERHGGRPLVESLVRWLAMIEKVPGLALTPDPAHQAQEAMGNPDLARRLSGHTAKWLWMWAEEVHAYEVFELIRKFLLNYSANPGSGVSVAFICSHSSRREAVELASNWLLLKSESKDPMVVRWAKKWLAENIEHPQAYQVLSSLVKSRPADSEIVEQAEEWLAANIEHPQTPNLLATLVRSCPSDPVVGRVKVWLDENIENAQAQQLAINLVKARPNDTEAVSRAKKWLDANIENPQAQQLLSVLVKSRRYDPSAVGRAMKWLAANLENPQAHQIAINLAKSQQNDPEVIRLTKEWLAANIEHSLAQQLLSTLVRLRPKDREVVGRAKKWLDANIENPQAYQLAINLVKSQPNDPEAVHRAKEWLDANVEHSQSCLLIAALLKSRPNDPEVVRRLKKWLAVNVQLPRAHQLIAALLKSRPNDFEVVRQAKEWLAANVEHPQVHQLIATLLKSRPNDPEAVRQAKEWLAENVEHPQTYQLILNLVRSQSNDFQVDPDVRTVARKWLYSHQNHPQAHRVAAQLERAVQARPVVNRELAGLGSLAHAFKKTRRDRI